MTDTVVVAADYFAFLERRVKELEQVCGAFTRDDLREVEIAHYAMASGCADALFAKIAACRAAVSTTPSSRAGQ